MLFQILFQEEKFYMQNVNVRIWKNVIRKKLISINRYKSRNKCPPISNFQNCKAVASFNRDTYEEEKR